MTNALGTLIEKMQYDAYGRLTALWTLAEGPITPVNGFISTETYYSETITGNPYLFQGQRLDPETGLYYFKNRYYDPTHGRFISRDPAGEGVNLYAFVNNNPINFVDPYGLDAQITWTEDNDAQVKSLKAALQNLIDAGKVQYYDKSWRSSGFFLVADTPGYVLLEKGKDLTLNDLTNALKDKYDTVFINRLYASMVREFESRDLKWSDTDKGATVEAPSLDERALTIRERDICGSMFGSTVAYDAVTIHMTSKLGQPGITLDNDIYMDPNNADIQSTWDSTLVHEMTHVWQYQRLTGGRTKWICLLGYIGDRRSRPRVGGNSS
jgi:RHS repeat-associated protein